MSDRLEAAEAALKAGRPSEAIDHLVAALAEDPARNAQVYRVLLLQLYRARRHAEGETWSAQAVQRHPRDFELWNIRGVVLRQLKRYPEALTALDQAAKLNPKNLSALTNRGNVLMDMGDYARAEAVFAKLARLTPRDAELQRQYGRALQRQGKVDAALVRYRQAVNIDKTLIDGWLDLTSTLDGQHRSSEVDEALERALAANPDHPRLLEGKVLLMRRAGESRRALAYLESLPPQHADAPWAQAQLAAILSDIDRDRANVHFRRALELAPDKIEYRMALVESLERTRTGDEAANIEEAYQLLKPVLASKEGFTPASKKIANEVLIRVCAFDEVDQLGDFRTLGREWAESGRHAALLKQLARVTTDEDRLELVEQHRIWGQGVEKDASRAPIRRPAPRPAGGKIRLGLMSSDLRRHPVAYFALPLFDHLDRERFEVFCYSYYQGQEDPVQSYIAEKVDGFRWWPDITARDAAQKIADDQLDILIELGGSTHMNKLDVMAYRPAPRQASWLGYPHSAGLAEIDYLVCDPYSKPARPELLMEQPLLMPKSWIALGRQIFSTTHVIEPGLPEDRAGRITFGTANNPHKYNRRTLKLWAQVLNAVPGSHFAFIRPEGGTPSFVANLCAEFEAHGVSAERIEFHTIRGAHMPYYNRVDITLDPAPLTGGTTTTESLWMGVPVVSLIGPAFYERLSYSILTNAGVGDLATEDEDQYVRIAAALAADRERRTQLRTGLREAMTDGPLGQLETFASDFYDMIAGVVGR
jgi:predicted O-linked N-acetylglucosamine transferase (SPINDLY family)